MTKSSQRTISKDVTLVGTGIHSGESTTITLRPAGVGAGIRFRRIDIDGQPEIPATLSHVVATELGTSLGSGGAQVRTVEHLMAALGAAQIDNILIDLDGLEVPIRDGSFQDYVLALKDAGLSSQGEKPRVVSVKDTVATADEDGQSYVATMNSGFTISAAIEFDHLLIGRQSGEFTIDFNRFQTELARARTFGFKKDKEELHARGLALGASLDNTVVLDQDSVMGGKLRFPNEFLRHKVGDLIGGIPGYRARIRPIVSRITIHWPSFYNVVTGKTLALPNLIALQHIPLSPAGVIAKRPAPIALPNSCAAEWRMAPDAVFSPYASVRYFTPHMVHSQYNLL